MRSRAGVILVRGDSGIGKSTFLGSLNADPSSSELISDVQVLRSTAGSLQNAIASALGDCLLQSAEDETRQRLVWESVKSSVLRAATGAKKELGRVLVSRATEIVEAKIGREATALIRSVVDEVLLPPRALLEDQLSAFAVADAAEEIGRLVQDVAVATERTLLLRMDAAERLGRDDRDLLVELATELGGNARLVVTANDQHPEGQELQRLLEGRNSEPHELGPLPHEDVEAWLIAESVMRNHWSQVIRISDGYPLFIQDAIRLVKAGISLSSIETPRSFQSVFEQSFRRVDAGLQSRIIQIAAFSDPPPDDYLAGLLGLSSLELTVFEQKLVDEGVFIRRPDGVAWFHDRRRDYLWNSRLTAKQRQAVAITLLDSFQGRLREKSGVESWLALSTPAVLAAAGTEDLDPDVSRVLNTETNELALLASMIELIEPDQNPAAHTREIAAHAATRFSYAGDPIADLEALKTSGMIELASNAYASVAAPVIPSGFAYATLIGEIQHRFGLELVPGRALRSFEAFIKPLLGRFDSAVVFLQRATLSDLSSNFRGSVAKNEDPQRRRSKVGLGIVLVIDDQPVSVVAHFDDAAERTAARSSLVEGIRSSSARNHIQVERIEDLPASRVPYARFENLIKDRQRQHRTVMIRSQAELADLLYERAVSADRLASSLSDYEAAALGIERRRRFIVDIRGERMEAVVFEIATSHVARTVVATVASEVPLFEDPLIELRLRAQGLISAEERLTGWTAHLAVTQLDEAVVETIDDVIKQGRKFNKDLPRVPIPLDEEELAERIQNEMTTARNLEDELVRGGLLEQSVGNRDDSLLVLLNSGEPSSDRWHPWGASTFWIRDGRAQVCVRVLPENQEPPPMFATAEELAAVGIKNASAVTRTGDGVASFVLADLLGYTAEDVAIQDPRFPEYF